MRLLPFFLVFVAFVNAQSLPSKRLVIPVDTVQPATTPYNTWPTLAIIEQDVEEKVLVCSEPEKRMVPTNQHSFLKTVHLAYAQHHDLVLSPDDIWIQISLGVSIHINEHFEELKAIVLKNPEKEIAQVRLDELTDLSPESWKKLIASFAEKAQAKTNEQFYTTMLPEFTTTTSESRTVMQAILLSSIQQALEFHAASGCGIPNIVLLGEKADWEKLYRHTEMLDQYGLGFWTTELKPILQEFINAYDGNVNRNFWQCIYKYREEYMVMDMNGWISKFFPYFTENESIDSEEELAKIRERFPEQAEQAEVITQKKYYLNPYLRGDDYLFNAIDIRDLPNSVCRIPVVWDNFFSNDPEQLNQQLMLYAGFTGTQQYENLALEPNCGWYIVHQDSFDIAGYDDEYLGAGKHREDWSEVAWSYEVVSDDKGQIIYHPEKFSQQPESLNALKKELADHLKKHFPVEQLAGTTLTFFVTHFGSCSTATISGGTLSEKAQAELLMKMNKLDHHFRPVKIQEESEASEVDGIITAPTAYNARISITF